VAVEGFGNTYFFLPGIDAREGAVRSSLLESCIAVDGSVAVVAIGAGTSLDSTKLNSPIVGFILDQKGLMYNLTLEGSKFTKINK
jgi:lipid-binding SYLF domain-containing protein